MIVYQANKEQFINDVFSNDIENIIHNSVKKQLNRSVGGSEVRAWQQSLSYMERIMNHKDIPADCGIAIEYSIPQTTQRIDFIITGKNEQQQENVILIELKQWSEAQLTQKDAIVSVRMNKGIPTETNHPSYQAWSYAALLESFNETVYEEQIQLKPCAYLHNYIDDGIITNAFYEDHISKAPLFLKADAAKLRAFITEHIRYGDSADIMYRIDKGRIRPSKTLADSMVAMLEGNDEFVMIDDQKVVFETAMLLAKQSTDRNKNVLIVEGGPGTGKSVIAVNLLVKIIELGLLTQYVTKNTAPRAVYERYLTGTMKKTHISNLFKGSGGFWSQQKNFYDALLADEAHRLNAKSGLFNNLGENQVKEIINVAKCAVFFIDEDQRVTLKDIGSKEEIIKWAGFYDATVHKMELSSQFRCSGSNGYIAWLDDVLQIRDTANEKLDKRAYDFKICATPTELRDIIFEKNKTNNKARLLAGICWPWKSKKDPAAYDIVFREYDFRMQWNLTKHGGAWMINPESVNEVGCIHTSQGLDADYIGVIVGDDLIVRNGEVLTDYTKRAKDDTAIKGHKALLKKDKAGTEKFLDMIIRNTYRTLMTRGMKGCYVYFTDKETEEYFRSRVDF